MNMITATEFKLKNNQLKQVYDYTISRAYDVDNETYSDVSIRITNDLFVDKTVVLKNPSENWDALELINRAKKKIGK